MNKKRYYVNFPSLVDGKILCEFFKTADAAEKFAKSLKVCRYYEIDCGYTSGTLNFIDNEIYQCNTDENYRFLSERHYLNEIIHYI